MTTLLLLAMLFGKGDHCQPTHLNADKQCWAFVRSSDQSLMGAVVPKQNGSKLVCPATFDLKKVAVDGRQTQVCVKK